MDDNLIQILEIFAGMIVLVPLSGILIYYLQQLLVSLKIGRWLTIVLVIGFVGALPELLIGAVAIYSNQPELALGNALGTSIVLMTLIAGIVAVYNRDFKTNELFSNHLLSFLTLLVVVLLILAADGTLGVTDGLILLLGYGIYMFTLLQNTDKYAAAKIALSKPHHFAFNGLLVILCLIAMIFAAIWVVAQSEYLILLAGLPAIFVGLSLLAPMGTMPELVFEMELNSRKKSTLTLTEIFTSLITNSTLVIGLVAIFRPFQISNPQIFNYNALIMALVILLFNYFTRTRKSLNTKEGIFLIACYFIFLFGNFALLFLA